MTETIRLATWNIWWRHGDWEARQPAILEILHQLDADVIGLQEVCSGEPDQVAWLRDELGYHVTAAPGGDDDRFTVVNAIASRWPVVDSAWEYLEVGEMPKHRSLLRVTIESPVGPLHVYTTHLSHGFHQSALRQRQLAQIAQRVAADRVGREKEYPPVLLGDLNAVPDSDEIRQLVGLAASPAAGLVFTDAWAQVGEGGGATYSESNPHVVDSAWPERRLDYILVGWPRPRPRGNPQRADLFGTGPVEGIVASDHYGLVVDLREVGPTQTDKDGEAPMQSLGPPVQIAYAVVDAEEAARRWAADFGAGPFFLSPHIPVTEVIHRGRPAEFDHTSAYGQWGSIMVELVQDHGSGPSAVRDLYAPGETGLHHLAYFVDDLDDATAMLATMGFELAQSARAGSTRFNFIDAVEATGHFLELYEPSDALLGFYSRVAQAAQSWDGTEPIRDRGRRAD